MKTMTKMVLTLGVILLAGVWYGAAVQAKAPAKQEVAAEEKILQAYGSTLVLSKEPVDEMFSHSTHVISLEMECDSCHPDLFDKKRGAAQEAGDYTMAAFADGQYCGACHDGDSAFNTTDKETCVTCHGSDMVEPETVIFNVPVKTVIFEHTEHVEMGYECSSCHNALFKMKKGAAESQPDKFTMQALYDGKYCGGCHNGDDAFASDTRCTTCHIGVLGLSRLQGGSPEKEGH